MNKGDLSLIPFKTKRPTIAGIIIIFEEVRATMKTLEDLTRPQSSLSCHYS